jgi:hypothetical protein
VYDPIATGFNPHGTGRGPESDAVGIPMRLLYGKLRLIRSQYGCTGNNEEKSNTVLFGHFG